MYNCSYYFRVASSFHITINIDSTLLSLMGVPYIDAPGEAEAQCAHMVKNGAFYAAATEDSDALVFGNNVKVMSYDPY